MTIKQYWGFWGTILPNNLRKFEAFTLGSLLIGVVIGALQITMWANSLQSALEIAGFQLLVIAIVATLVLLISRKQSKVAKWLWLILFLGGLYFYIPELGNMLEQGLIGILSVVQLIMQLIGMYFLFLNKR